METLLDRARQAGNPIIDGEAAIFVWGGERAPDLIGDFNGWGWPDTATNAPAALLAVAPGVWAHEIRFPADAYIEYSFARDGRRVADPLNRRVVDNGAGAQNAWFTMPGYRRPPETWHRPDIPHGTLTTTALDGQQLVAGGRRTVRFYQPPTDQPAPLLVVWDGNDFLFRGGILPVVEQLMAAGAIPPLAMALIDHGGDARFLEYCCSDATLGFVVRHVLPAARARLNLVDPAAQPGVFGVLGASMGGLMALYAGLRLPETFGHVVSFSGAFGWRLTDQEMVIHQLVRHSPPPPLRLWLNVGQFEWLLAANRGMRDLLLSRGYPFTYREYPGGHNYTAWRDELARSLRSVFGPPRL